MATMIPPNRAAFELQQLVAFVQGEWDGSGCTTVEGVSTDTRTLVPGNVFVALVGERFDGHEHVEAAMRAGARAVVVSRPVEVPGGYAVIRVKDTLEALGKLGCAHRQRWARQARANGEDKKIVAVTGSAGKTTTCRATTAVLDAVGNASVHASAGNMNNAVGIPMVLLGLDSSHGQAVVEVGTNHPGEIAYGASLVQPDVAVVTLVACAHTLGLGTIDDVANEKAALLAALDSTGVAVVNADDPLVMARVGRTRARRVLTFGKSERAAVRIVGVKSRGWQGQTVVYAVGDGSPNIEFNVDIPLLGDAGSYATAAALAAAWGVWGDAMDWQRAVHGLQALRSESGRLRVVPLRCGAIVIDDAYNANPASIRDSVDVAARMGSGRGGGLTLVLGEMRELGEHSEREHRRVGEQVGKVRPSAFVAVGGDAWFMAEQARALGANAVFVDDAERAVAAVLERIGGKDVILVKGSRGVALEHVVGALEAWGEGQSA